MKAYYLERASDYYKRGRIMAEQFDEIDQSTGFLYLWRGRADGYPHLDRNGSPKRSPKAYIQLNIERID